MFFQSLRKVFSKYKKTMKEITFFSSTLNKTRTLIRYDLQFCKSKKVYLLNLKLDKYKNTWKNNKVFFNTFIFRRFSFVYVLGACLLGFLKMGSTFFVCLLSNKIFFIVVFKKFFIK